MCGTKRLRSLKRSEFSPTDGAWLQFRNGEPRVRLWVDYPLNVYTLTELQLSIVFAFDM